VLVYVEKLLGGVDCPLSLGHLPGSATTVQAVAKKNRLAGMSWILPVSQMASPAEVSPL
jgi:hypothetical protein